MDNACDRNLRDCLWAVPEPVAAAARGRKSHGCASGSGENEDGADSGIATQSDIEIMETTQANEYDLMFHYLLAVLRRADGANSVTASGVKTFNIFAGLGEHR